MQYIKLQLEDQTTNETKQIGQGQIQLTTDDLSMPNPKVGRKILSGLVAGLYQM